MTEIPGPTCQTKSEQSKNHRIGWVASPEEALGGYIGCLDCETPVDKIPPTDQIRQVITLWTSTVS